MNDFDILNIEKQLAAAVGLAFQDLFGLNLPAESLTLQPTRKEFEGHYTFMMFAHLKQTGLSPDALGQALGSYLTQNMPAELSGFNIVKGFLNLVVSDAHWLSVFDYIASTPGFGNHEAKNQTVMVEYSSPNTNKPIHLGHLRNIFLGYSMVQILESYGYKVIKANLINDRGIHICKSMLAYQKFGNHQTPASSGIKGDHLIGKYYVEFNTHYQAQIEQLIGQGIALEKAKKQAPIMLEAQQMLLLWEQDDQDTIALWKLMNGWVYEGFETTYRRMGVSFDKYYYESDTYLLGKDIIREGLATNVFFKKPDGSVWIDLTSDGLDEKLLLRSDGTSVYITQDLGTADLKYTDFQASKSLYVVGNEQDYHFQVLFAILKKMGRSYADGLFHLSYGMVDLPSGRMKSREGNVVDADEIMEEMVRTVRARTLELGKELESQQASLALYEMLGIGAIKYFLLRIGPAKRMLFNPEESIDLQGNTATAIQYTHARICSVLKKAQERQIPLVWQTAALESGERELIVALHNLPAAIALAAQKYDPSQISDYAYELSRAYNKFFQEYPILNADSVEQQSFRVALSRATAGALLKAMGLLGIGCPERM